MPLVINTNVAALRAQQGLNTSQHRLQTSFQRLSSGFRINSAADDAAGLAISESLRAKVASFAVAERNTLNAVSMANTAEGALGEMSGIVIRMRELAVQSANGDLNSTDRSYLDTEYLLLAEEIDRLSSSTQFNGIDLLGGTATSIAFQVGVGTSSSDTISVGFGGVSASSLGLNLDNLSGGTIETNGNANGSINVTSVGVGGSAQANGNSNSNVTVSGVTGTVYSNGNSNSNVTVSDVTGTVEANGNSNSTVTVSNIAGTVQVNGVSNSNIHVKNVAAGVTVYINGTSNATVDVSNVASGTVDFTGVANGTYTLVGNGGDNVIGIGGANANQAKLALTKLDDMLAQLSTVRASFGAAVNRLGVAVSNSRTIRTNLAAANSAIRDVDVAEETSALSRSQVALQAGASVLAQANQAPSLVLSLLG